MQPARANTIGALFIFLYLLEAYSELVAKRLLAHVQHQPAHPHPAPDILVDRIWDFRDHYRLGDSLFSAGRHPLRIRSLHWRTRHRAVGTEDAAIVRLRPQPRPAARAIIEKLARIARHRFRLRGSTVRTRNDRLKDHGTFLRSIPVTMFTAQRRRRQRPGTRLSPDTFSGNHFYIRLIGSRRLASAVSFAARLSFFVRSDVCKIALQFGQPTSKSASIA